MENTNERRSGVMSSFGAGRRNVAGVSVRRLLPALRFRAIGPFVFLDHLGPEILAPGLGVDVPPHPHINLATVTYLFDGELVHRDSLGSKQTIAPGDINWMHAGSGIVHSERTASRIREQKTRIEAIQMWVALPKAQEETEPWFEHYAESELPLQTGDGFTVRVLVGSALELRSPVRTLSSTLYVDVILGDGAQFPVPAAPERAAYIADGTVSLNGEVYPAGRMIVFRPGAEALVTAQTVSHILILGGEPLDSPRHIWWNFVSSSGERIERAKRDWAEHRFPPVPGDEVERAEMPDR